MIVYSIFYECGRIQKWESEKPLSLETFQKIIGGFIEIVRGSALMNGKIGPVIYVVDEEGLIKNRPINKSIPQFRGHVIVTTEEGVK